MASFAASTAVEVGRVGRAHGLRGAFTVRLHDPSSTALDRAAPAQLALRRADGALLAGLRVVGRAGAGGRILTVEGVVRREQAEALRGAAVWVERAALGLAPGEVLLSDLIGCRVLEGTVDYGEVVEVFEAGAAPVLVVSRAGEERMIPFAEGTVVSVDLPSKRLEISDGEQWPVQPAQDPALGRPWRGGPR